MTSRVFRNGRIGRARTAVVMFVSSAAIQREMTAHETRFCLTSPGHASRRSAAVSCHSLWSIDNSLSLGAGLDGAATTSAASEQSTHLA